MAKLTVSGNQLFLGGIKLKGHIGFNSFHPFEQYLNGGTSGTWMTAIDITANAGAKIIKIPLMPRYPTPLATNVYTFSSPNYSLRAAYITRINAILSYAATKGVSVLGVAFWRLASAGDIASASPSTIEDRNSAAREFCRQIMTLLVSNFESNAALAGWQTATEPDSACYSGTVSYGISVPDGTPASYSSATDIMSYSGIVDFSSEMASIVKAVNPNAFVINGHIGPAPNNTGMTWFANMRDYCRDMSAYSMHSYISSDCGDRTAYSAGMAASTCFHDNNKPVVLDEFGAQITGGSTSLLDDADGSKIVAMYEGARAHGVPLMLEWQLAQAADDSFYGIWPGETRGTQRLAKIAEYNAAPVYEARPAMLLPSRPPYKTVARLPGSATGYFTVTNSAALNNASFTVMCWARVTLGTSGSLRRLASKGTTGTPSGWEIILSTAGTASDAKGLYTSLITNNAGSAVRVEGDDLKIVRGLDRWVHFAFTFDGTYIRRYYNGMQIGTLSAITYSYSSSSTNLFIGSDGSSLHFVGDISDFRIYPTVLSQSQIVSAGCGGYVGSPAGWWKLDGNGDDYSGNANHASAGAAVTYASLYTAKTTTARSVVSRSVAFRGLSNRRATMGL